MNFFEPVWLSLQIALFASVVVIILGTVIGRIMARSSFRGKLVLETFFICPMVLPPTVIGFLLIVIFGKNSPIGQMIERVFDHPIIFTKWAAIIAAVVVSFPLMYQAAKIGFSNEHIEIEEGAQDLGANAWKVFWYITLPIAFRSLIGGAILSFVRALGEFGATLMFAGNIPGKTQTIPMAIYIAIDSGNMTLAWLWVITTIVLSIGFLSFTQVLQRKKDT
ncbi:molybdate ABC transporter permease subunit [Bacillus sp. 165]|uniref:molybdate ABC transporter permease subunit n=1 Tax=Bacillus sp. 165 TaxID=1529117 RepID=UPI001ADAEC9F|nr:molybdate ABC transporter permease subunit [Bacillus sp. 165]MBO9130540.1 molybdate ABC transporter permease subunit [Bacillus sp. 165]